jgi:hypothetical protein
MLWQRGREISISFCLLSTPEVQTQGNSVTPRELDDQYYSAVATSLRPNSSFWVHLAMQSKTKLQFKHFVMCATNVWAACSFVIRIPDLTI